GGIKYFHANSILPDSQATGTDSVAIGPNAVSTNANSVALGANSTTSVGAQTSYAAYGLTALQNSAGEVSVGSAGNARKITNVAAGSAGTDAVNVGQLQAVDSKLNNVAADALSWDPTANGGAGAFNAKHNGAGPNKITSVAAGDVNATSTDAVNGSQLFSLVGNASTSYTTTNGTGVRYARTNDTGLTPDDAYAQGAGSTALGYQATASAVNSLALGNGAKANFSNSIALGAGSVDIVGALNNYVAYGLASPSSSSGELNIGNRQITGLAPGKNDTDAVNVEQLKAALANNNSGSSGGGGSGNGGGTSTGKNPVTYDDAGKTSITANPGGAPAQLHNVANGVANNDAVNVGQLNTGISSAVSQANSYTDGKLQNMQGNIDKNQHDADGGTAAAMAVAGLPQPSAPGKSMVSLAGSTYQGQSGMALGISTISEGGSWIYKVAATSSTRGKSGAVVGAGFQW
ncbi:Autotransporter adhesin, partial [Collimonas sp. OK307]|uniref:YadA family autotransporter adhesin n=1 Tax=Collimonas sp. OK307 TaxID=1801620 RepID=UPI0008E4E740